MPSDSGASTLNTIINAFDPREIIIGFVEMGAGQDPLSILRIDVEEAA